MTSRKRRRAPEMSCMDDTFRTGNELLTAYVNLPAVAHELDHVSIRNCVGGSATRRLRSTALRGRYPPRAVIACKRFGCVELTRLESLLACWRGQVAQQGHGQS